MLWRLLALLSLSLLQAGDQVDGHPRRSGEELGPRYSGGRVYRITLNIFSGRPDPEWTITETDPSFEQLSVDLEAASNTNLSSCLGYRGFTVEFTDRNGWTLWKTIGKRSNVNLEEMLVMSCGHLDPELDQYVRSEIQQNQNKRTSRPDRGLEINSVLDDAITLLAHSRLALILGRTNFLEPERFEDLSEIRPYSSSSSSLRFKRHAPSRGAICKQPVYDPENWNYLPVRRLNNCYNYATNTRTNTYAQPGRGSGRPYNNYTSQELLDAVTRDGLIPLNGQAPSPFQTLGPCLIALVIWPRVDFHFYRLDNNGLWSHKRGQTRVKNVDESNALISDPRFSDRGPYTEFVSFLGVFDKVNIR